MKKIITRLFSRNKPKPESENYKKARLMILLAGINPHRIDFLKGLVSYGLLETPYLNDYELRMISENSIFSNWQKGFIKQ
jgi:hypothetical protein